VLSVAGSGDQEPLVLALLPVEGRDLGPGEPGVDRRAQIGLPAEPCGKSKLPELDAEATAQLAQRAQLFQLQKPVEAVSGPGAPGNHEPGSLQVAQHAGRPAGLSCRVADGGSHGSNLNTGM